MKTINVLIVDDHLVVRMGVAAVLRYEPDICIIGEAEDGEQAITVCRASHPDVVIMDLRMPVLDGVEATQRICAEHPAIHVLVLTTFEDADGISAALEAGAHGVLLKNSSQSDLARAIRRVYAGERVVAKEIEQQLTCDMPHVEFTERQLEVLHSVTRGLTNRDIAKQLNISPDGVKSHLSAIFNKLGASGRSEAIAIAMRKHLLKF